MRFALATLFLGALMRADARKLCGTDQPSAELMTAHSDHIATIDSVGPPVVVETYFHVLRAGESAEQGNLPDSMLNEQVSSPSTSLAFSSPRC